MANVVGGYLLAAAFIALVAINKPEASSEEQLAAEDPEGLFVDTDEITGANEIADPDKPVIELAQGDRVTVPLGGVYVEPGFTAKAADGTLLTDQVTVSGADKINSLVPGISYPIDYMVTDSEGNTKTVTRYVNIVDNRFAHDAGVGIDRGNGVILDDSPDVAVIDNPGYVVDDRIGGRNLGNNVHGGGIGGIGGPDVVGHGGGHRGGADGGVDVVGRDRGGIGDDDGALVDLGALDRALEEERVVEERYDVDDRADRNFRGLDVDRRKDAENVDFKADIGDFAEDANAAGDGLGVDKGGKLYAYETPSLGVGAGIGTPAIGAGVGAAGIGAGIGEAVLDGKPVPALGGTGTYAPPANAAPAGPDGDGDALPDALEAAYGTDPAKSDSDSDGFSDADEVKALSNPNDPRSKPGNAAPTGDPDVDGDGLSASLERAYGTNPEVADSDGDGFNDGQELSSMTIPTDAKSNPGAPGIGGPAMAMGPGAAGGVGGLVSGAGTGGAAGLVSGMVKQPLGLGIGCTDCGDKGCADCGVGGHGHGGRGGDHDFDERRYDDLPPDGNLWIMMHVDGSGSILETRKSLEEMRGTIMKQALLPYYLNDENLYNRRVVVVDGNGERTLQFFKEATKKDNVLAFVFQDEAQPIYHMPNFNKEPEEKYLEDLKSLKGGLGGYGGLYRGVMFQVDRGRTHAKSFKEFVGNAWRGEGYLSGANLKKYYWEENRHHIKNHDGVVFSDVYHVKDDADPQYYMNLIFEASRKVGVDLQKYGGGLEDGNYNPKTQSD